MTALEILGIAIAIIVVFACLGFLFAITAEDDVIEADARWTAFSRKQDEATRNVPYGDHPALPRVDAPRADYPDHGRSDRP